MTRTKESGTSNPFDFGNGTTVPKPLVSFIVLHETKNNMLNKSTTHLQRDTNPDTTANLRKRVLLANASKTLDTIKTSSFDKSASTLYGVCQHGRRRKPCFNFLFIVHRHIQLDVINLALCISSTFIYKLGFS